MIVVMKLITGEEVIGALSCDTDEEFKRLPTHLRITDPMWIVPAKGGALKLQDACMLSENEELIFNSKDVIINYRPSANLTKYYLRVCEYSKEFTRPGIDAQIDLATEDLDQQMRDEKKEAVLLGELYRKITGTKLH